MYKILGLIVLVIIVLIFVTREARVEQPCKEDIIPIYNASTGQVEQLPRVCKTEAEWKRILTAQQYRVTRQKGTEPPGTCGLIEESKPGIFECVCCGTDLFKHGKKFESGTGWPSFWAPVSELNVKYVTDTSHGMRRTEVLCARCGAHLGHVFDDGPPPTGKRYCMNSVALKPVPKQTDAKLEKATFAAGCFWGVESSFRTLLGKGVVSTRVGYTGGDFPNPSYKDVCTGRTSHVEAVEVTYDPSKISYKQLLDVFWKGHNPYRSDGQGPDIGSQYRAVIFYHMPEQRRLAEESKAALEKSKGEIATKILPAKEFYPAEDYHQQYYEKQGIAPACPIY